MIKIARRYDKEEAKSRLLSVCVKLFIEKGYAKTTNAEILRLTELSNGTFYNIFHSKDGVLLELTEFMFSNQFSLANEFGGEDPDPVFLYALETSIQMTLTELNENLREIYVEAYTHPQTIKFINEKTAGELYKFFGSYLPDYSEADFYELEIGTSGIMRAYMARKCDWYFPLSKKLRRFLETNLSILRVPVEKQEEVINKVLSVDVTAIANAVMQKLFEALAMKYDFVLESKTEENM